MKQETRSRTIQCVSYAASFRGAPAVFSCANSNLPMARLGRGVNRRDPHHRRPPFKCSSALMAQSQRTPPYARLRARRSPGWLLNWRNRCLSEGANVRRSITSTSCSSFPLFGRVQRGQDHRTKGDNRKVAPLTSCARFANLHNVIFGRKLFS